MFGIRIHGRGGQGVVTAAETLSLAAFLEDRHAQAFPSSGSERTGAPVVAFCRIATAPIRVREPIVAPDCLLVQDPTLLHEVDVFGGLRAGGTALVNSTRTPQQLGVGDLDARVLTVPAEQIARRRLGRPLPGAPLLGGFAAMHDLVSLASVQAALRARLPGAVGEANAAAAGDAHAHVSSELEELTRAY
jgi:pyruvate ferredoxin oxidoreductase gamma subunit